jgi:zinc D-Ala-D-Ala carboxypeptidase
VHHMQTMLSFVSRLGLDGVGVVGHYSTVPWSKERWPNFDPIEFACSCCGEFYWDAVAFDKIQAVRTLLGKPLRINSSHRCPIHNAKVGGAPLSQHKKIAFDISIIGHDQWELLAAARAAGFTGFGFYLTFLHVDLGNAREWYNSADARKQWTPAQS